VGDEDGGGLTGAAHWRKQVVHLIPSRVVPSLQALLQVKDDIRHAETKVEQEEKRCGRWLGNDIVVVLVLMVLVLLLLLSLVVLGVGVRPSSWRGLASLNNGSIITSPCSILNIRNNLGREGGIDDDSTLIVCSVQLGPQISQLGRTQL